MVLPAEVGDHIVDVGEVGEEEVGEGHQSKRQLEGVKPQESFRKAEAIL